MSSPANEKQSLSKFHCMPNTLTASFSFRQVLLLKHSIISLLFEDHFANIIPALAKIEHASVNFSLPSSMLSRQIANRLHKDFNLILVSLLSKGKTLNDV